MFNIKYVRWSLCNATDESQVNAHIVRPYAEIKSWTKCTPHKSTPFKSFNIVKRPRQQNSLLTISNQYVQAMCLLPSQPATLYCSCLLWLFLSLCLFLSVWLSVFVQFQSFSLYFTCRIETNYQTTYIAHRQAEYVLHIHCPPWTYTLTIQCYRKEYYTYRHELLLFPVLLKFLIRFTYYYYISFFWRKKSF